MVPDVYILLSPQEKAVHYSSWGHRCTHSAVYSSKIFKPLSDIILLCEVYCRIGKCTNKELNYVMVFIMRPSSTLKLQFVFDFNESLWEMFFFITFWKFLILYLGCGCVTFGFMTQMTSNHLLPMPMNKKHESKDYQIYSKMLRKIC